VWQLAQNEMKAKCRMPVWVRSNEGLGVILQLRIEHSYYDPSRDHTSTLLNRELEAGMQTPPLELWGKQPDLCSD
jgi:hypothetical protein